MGKSSFFRRSSSGAASRVGKALLVCFVFTLWGVGGLFAQHPALGGGSGTQADPYLISTPAHWVALSNYVGADNGKATSGVYYKLMNDIDLSVYGVCYPMGSNNANRRFRGNIDGNGKEIQNLTITGGASYSGLFAYINNARIENLGVVIKDSVRGGAYVGGLVGYADSSFIQNCYVKGGIVVQDLGNDGGVGGLVGQCNNSTITSCYSLVDSIHTRAIYELRAGGLVGRCTTAVITNCYATSNVSPRNRGWSGGLVGATYGSSVTGRTIISGCYATGSVKGEFAGGLVGAASFTTITNCYATGNVGDISGISNYVGGLVGGAQGTLSTTISYCYATGKVKGYYPVGGLGGKDNFQNCVAANDSIISTLDSAGFDTAYHINVNRITGSPLSNSNNCYAFSGMGVKIGDSIFVRLDDNTINGIGKDMATLKSLAFYNADSNWADASWNVNAPSSVWRINDGEGLPFLCWQNNSCEEATTHTITATAGSNGSISPSGAVSVTEGNNQTFTFTANSNYEIDQVLIDNVNNPAAVTAGTYTFVNVTADHSIAVSFKETVGIVETASLPSIRIYPNPTTGKLTIDNGQWTIKNVEIFDVIGQKVNHQSSIVNCQLSIDISHLANGMYFLKIENRMFKIIKN